MTIDVAHLQISAVGRTPASNVGHCLREAIPLVRSDDFADLLRQLDRLPYRRPLADAA
jgi:hypothetical protein